MTDYLSVWLTELGIPQTYLALSTVALGILLLLVIATVCYYLAKRFVLEQLKRWVGNTKNSWDDMLAEHHVFSRLSTLVPLVVVFALTPSLLAQHETIEHGIITFIKVAICLQSARCLSAILNVIKNTYLNKAQEKYLPLNATIQVLKLLVYLVSIILAVALVVDRSPLYLLSGLGALTAVLLLVFQDTIKGLVASIQISANKMVAPGDWIEMPSYGADGDVLEIGLNTVKVRNFDNTITTVPTYALISHSFKNWRGMAESQGRRIKRAITFDINSIEFISTQQLETLLTNKLIDEALYQQLLSLTNELLLQEKLTNLSAFRRYLEHYASSQNSINPELTCMVRQLAPTTEGVPLELYCFSKEKRWQAYENIQADIFDHILAIAPYFQLRIFQQPSGFDWQVSKLKEQHQ